MLRVSSGKGMEAKEWFQPRDEHGACLLVYPVLVPSALPFSESESSLL